MKNLQKIFTQFNCTDREIDIYLTLLQQKPLTIKKLAEKMSQNRVTIHSAVQKMIEKGFLFETRQGKRRLVAAESPEILKTIFNQKTTELQAIGQNLDTAIESLMNIKRSESHLPTVKFYEGVDGLKKMLEETLTTQGEVLVFSYVELLADLLEPDYLEAYFRRRANKGIATRLIFPPCDFAERVNEKNEQYKIQVKFLPESYTWKSGIFAWDNKLAILSYTEKKVTCTIIENDDIAFFYRQIIFDFVWQKI